jgi:hypothetical protein
MITPLGWAMTGFGHYRPWNASSRAARGVCGVVQWMRSKAASEPRRCVVVWNPLSGLRIRKSVRTT